MEKLKSIEEAISRRHSVRKFTEERITDAVIDEIKNYISGIENPFSIKTRYALVGNITKEFGVTSNAKNYLAAIYSKGDFDLEAVAYGFEKAMLYCVYLGLSTAWVDDAMNKVVFGLATDLKSDERIIAVAPIGYDVKKSDGKAPYKRLPFDKLFFDEDFSKGLTIPSAGKYYNCFESVRIAPSKGNKQPWRLLKSGKKVHFFSIDDNSRMDMGCAIAHFELAACERGYQGHFAFEEPNVISNYCYVITWFFD